VALLGALAFSLLLRRFGPSRLTPLSFLASGLLLVLEWTLLDSHPGRVAILFYLHFAGLGSSLVSLFWSLVNEAYDPRRAKREVARIGSAAAAGGVLGALLAERLAAWSLDSLGFVALATIHLGCAFASWRMRVPNSSAGRVAGESWLKGLRAARSHSLIRGVVLLVVVNALAAGLIDYAFKAQAAARFTGPELLRFFAFFYLAIGIATLLVQGLLARYLLERGGLQGALSQLPLGVLAGSFGALLIPGLLFPGLTRGWEMIVRSSFYRSAYELLYTPVSPDLKRSSKAVIDVGAERFGDAVAGLLLQGFLIVAPGLALQGSLWLAGLAAAAGLLIVRQVGRGYVRALEESLKERVLELNLMTLNEETARATLWRTATLQGGTTQLTQLQDLTRQFPPTKAQAKSIVNGTTPDVVPQDPVLRLKRDLKSGDPGRVRPALKTRACASVELLPQLFALLAWEEAVRWVTPVLQRLVPRATGAMLDRLLDPEEDLMVRRRIPSILASHPSGLGAHGLFQGLEDDRFEIRFHCVQSLLRMTPKLDWTAPPGQIFKLAHQELKVEPRQWRNRRLPEREMRRAPLLRGLKRPPSDPSLLHLFSLFCLIYPEDAMRLSFQAFATRDDRLRGTAMEYLESLFPADLAAAMLSLLDMKGMTISEKGQGQALEDLMKSQELIVATLLDQGDKPPDS